MKKRVLYLTKYSENGPSSRVRTFQLLDYFSKDFENFNYFITISPFFSAKYIDLMYNGKNSYFEFIRGFFKRCHLLFRLNNFDAVVIEKELFPRMPVFFYKFFKIRKIPYLVDYDDATFDISSNKYLLYKYNYLLSNAAIVSCGNSYLINRVKQFGAKKTIYIPSVIDDRRYFNFVKKTKVYNNDSEIIIGWVGTPSTIHYLEDILNVFEVLSVDFKIRLVTIGAEISSFFLDNRNIDYKFFSWDLETEVEEISKFDIGIMPLRNSSWEKGKCAYKLIQYMALGVPVVGSKISANIEVIGEKEEFGLLAVDLNDWILKLTMLIENKSLRNKFGSLGKTRIFHSYSINSIKDKYFNTLDELINNCSK
jgi:glycosyltransferase involved in cell wall biosynthesis